MQLKMLNFRICEFHLNTDEDNECPGLELTRGRRGEEVRAVWCPLGVAEESLGRLGLTGWEGRVSEHLAGRPRLWP